MKLRDLFLLRTALAFVAGGIGTLFFSILVETFLFRPFVKARPELFPRNRELNSLALILASIISGVVAVRLARSFSLWTLTKDEEQHPTLLVVSAALGTAVALWLLRNVVADNPLTVGWRGILMCSAAIAAGGSLLTGGRTRWLAWGALIAMVVVGLRTVRYDYICIPYSHPIRAQPAPGRGDGAGAQRQRDRPCPAARPRPRAAGPGRDVGCQQAFSGAG